MCDCENAPCEKCIPFDKDAENVCWYDCCGECQCHTGTKPLEE